MRLRPEKLVDDTDAPVIADADNVYVKSVAGCLLHIQRIHITVPLFAPMKGVRGQLLI